MIHHDIDKYCEKLRTSTHGPLLAAFANRLELFSNAISALENNEEDQDIKIRLALGNADEQELAVLVSNAKLVSARLGELLAKVSKLEDLGLE